MWVGGAVAALGLISVLVGLVPLREHSYWVGYSEGMREGGALAIFFGLVLAGLAAAHQYTHFFDLKRRMPANRFAISLAIILVITGASAAIVTAKLPTTPESTLKRMTDRKQREKRIHDERLIKQMAAAMILVAGSVIAFYPTRRFFRR